MLISEYIVGNPVSARPHIHGCRILTFSFSLILFRGLKCTFSVTHTPISSLTMIILVGQVETECPPVIFSSRFLAYPIYKLCNVMHVVSALQVLICLLLGSVTSYMSHAEGPSEDLRFEFTHHLFTLAHLTLSDCR